MRTVLFVLAFFVLCPAANSQMQLANPVKVKLHNDKKLKKKRKRNKSRQESYFPFELAGGMILINAQVGDRRGDFVLDTGAPNLLLNKKVHRDSADTKGSDISGALLLKQTPVDYFQTGNLVLDKLDAYSLDLSHLERIKERPISGMIGQDLLKNHEVIIDYQRKLLMWLEPGRSQIPEDLAPVGFIPFRMQKHFIVVTVKIGGKRLRFGIDTGAEVNLLSAKTYSKLPFDESDEGDSIRIRGVKDNTLNSQKVKIPVTEIKNRHYSDLSYVVMDMQAMNKVYGVQLDGILGYPFLAAQKFSINYIDEKIYIWEEVFPDIEKIEVLANSEATTEKAEGEKKQ